MRPHRLEQVPLRPQILDIAARLIVAGQHQQQMHGKLSALTTIKAYSFVKMIALAVMSTALLLTSFVIPAAADDGSVDDLQGQSSTGESSTSQSGVLAKAGVDGYKVGVAFNRSVLESEIQLEDGTSRYLQAFKGVNLISKQDDLTFTIVAVLSDTSSEHKLAFELSLPDKASLSLQSNGSVLVLAEGGIPVGQFKVPWALDANGDKVETSFEVDGSTLIQHVANADPSAYPVYADPDFDAGYFSSTIYFNRWETALICAAGVGGFGSIIRSGTLFFITGPALPAILAAAATVVGVACAAETSSRCVKLKLIGHMIPVPLTYYNSQYCT